MNIAVAVLLIIYTLFHIAIKVGGMSWVLVRIYITKQTTFEEIKTPQITSVLMMWWSFFENCLMTFVFIYAITVLL